MPCSSPSPSYTLLKGRNSGYTDSTMYVGRREGMGMCSFKKSAQMQICPKAALR